MKKTLTLSLLAATIFGGMMFTAPAEAYNGWHHGWGHQSYNAGYYNPYVNANSYGGGWFNRGYGYGGGYHRNHGWWR